MPINRILALVAVSSSLLACDGYRYQRGYGARTSSSETRLTPATAQLPDGVGRGWALRVTYPLATPIPRALGDYLDRARARGALWISGLRVVYGAKCVQPLLPAWVDEETDVVYTHREEYIGGATDTHVSTRRGTVRVKYLRPIDDREGLAEAVAIYSSKTKGRCDTSMAIRLEADIHGREHIGITKGPLELDYRHCGAAPSEPKAPTSQVAAKTLPLGDLALLDEADRVLPSWLRLRVRVVHGQQISEGVLTAYRSRLLSVTTDDGQRVDVHALDALAVELLQVDAAAIDPSAPPKDEDESKVVKTECPASLARPPANVF